MKIWTIFLSGMLLFNPGLIFAWDIPAPTGIFQALRKPIDLDYGQYPLLSVIFNHSSHKKVKCITCHHIKNAENKLYTPCTNEDCHSLKGPRDTQPMSMFMAYHAPSSSHSCYACHVREAANHPNFKGCRPCHGPQNSPQKQSVQ